jgi:hypothetical protein
MIATFQAIFNPVREPLLTCIQSFIHHDLIRVEGDSDHDAFDARDAEEQELASAMEPSLQNAISRLTSMAKLVIANNANCKIKEYLN